MQSLCIAWFVTAPDNAGDNEAKKPKKGKKEEEPKEKRKKKKEKKKKKVGLFFKNKYSCSLLLMICKIIARLVHLLIVWVFALKYMLLHCWRESLENK